MKKNWKAAFLAGLSLSLCLSLAGCLGGGGGGTPGKPKSELPERKKISTPVASSFKVDDRTVNIYEYTGLTFRDQTLWTETLAVDGDRIYFFGFDNKEKTYRTKLRSVRYQDETLSDLKVLDGRALWRHRLVVSNGTVYDWHKKGDYKTTRDKSPEFWHYYDGKAMVATNLTGMSLIPIDQEKDVVYTQGANYWIGTLDKGNLTQGKQFLSGEEIRKAPINLKKRWADKNGLYLMGYTKNDKGEEYNVVRQFSLENGQLLQSFEGPPTKEGRGYAVTEHRVVMGQKGGIYWIYNKKDGKLLGKFKTEPKLTMEILTPMKNDSILIYRRINRDEAKLYRMDL